MGSGANATHQHCCVSITQPSRSRCRHCYSWITPSLLKPRSGHEQSHGITKPVSLQDWIHVLSRTCLNSRQDDLNGSNEDLDPELNTHNTSNPMLMLELKQNKKHHRKSTVRSQEWHRLRRYCLTDRAASRKYM